MQLIKNEFFIEILENLEIFRTKIGEYVLAFHEIPWNSNFHVISSMNKSLGIWSKSYLKYVLKILHFEVQIQGYSGSHTPMEY